MSHDKVEHIGCHEWTRNHSTRMSNIILFNSISKFISIVYMFPSHFH